ncbi:hypothetical protein V5799_021871 [Amblyomma americanum]|uniref:Uncharacterized protein n=1 Tax=Amblyomma americanum TaxID=6943 RepID=A0AAQ4FPI0_AMBAM
MQLPSDHVLCAYECSTSQVQGQARRTPPNIAASAEMPRRFAEAAAKVHARGLRNDVTTPYPSDVSDDAYFAVGGRWRFAYRLFCSCFEVEEDELHFRLFMAPEQF